MATASLPMGLFRLARPSIEGTLAANFAHGPGHGLTGATVAWHVMALADSHKLLTVIRGTELPHGPLPRGSKRAFKATAIRARLLARIRTWTPASGKPPQRRHRQ